LTKLAQAWLSDLEIASAAMLCPLEARITKLRALFTGFPYLPCCSPVAPYLFVDLLVYIPPLDHKFFNIWFHVLFNILLPACNAVHGT